MAVGMTPTPYGKEPRGKDCATLSLQSLKSGVTWAVWPLGKALLGDVGKLTSVEMMLGKGCAQSHLSLDLALEAGQPLAKNWLLIALGLGSRLLSPEC